MQVAWAVTTAVASAGLVTEVVVEGLMAATEATGVTETTVGGDGHAGCDYEDGEYVDDADDARAECESDIRKDHCRGFRRLFVGPFPRNRP